MAASSNRRLVPGLTTDEALARGEMVEPVAQGAYRLRRIVAVRPLRRWFCRGLNGSADVGHTALDGNGVTRMYHQPGGGANSSHQRSIATEGKPMTTTRRSRIALGALTALATILAGTAADAQTYPTRPIQVIIPFAGGSASDVVTRILLERAGKSLGQPFVVDNRPGAGGNIGTLQASKAAPDGYTLVGTGSGPHRLQHARSTRILGYDPEKDFEAISMFGVFPIVVVASAKLPVKTLSELIAYAKDRPNQLNYGSVGIGSSQHLSGAYFEQVVGVKLTHVPYRNIAQYTPDLIAGAVPLGFQWLPNVLAALNSGGANALAVASKTRMTALPNVPTTAEAGLPNYDNSGWFVMLAPQRNPEADRRASSTRSSTAALKDPAVQARFTEQGAEVRHRHRPRSSRSSSPPRSPSGATSSTRPASRDPIALDVAERRRARHAHETS